MERGMKPSIFGKAKDSPNNQEISWLHMQTVTNQKWLIFPGNGHSTQNQLHLHIDMSEI